MLTLSAHNSVLKFVQQILKTDSETTFQGLSNGVGFNRVCHILCERVPCKIAPVDSWSDFIRSARVTFTSHSLEILEVSHCHSSHSSNTHTGREDLEYLASHQAHGVCSAHFSSTWGVSTPGLRIGSKRWGPPQSLLVPCAAHT